ncbi:MAG: excinuclease ABC subunit A, partial [Candidatus Berkelbacteria bacterium Licking1014_85]
MADINYYYFLSNSNITKYITIASIHIILYNFSSMPKLSDKIIVRGARVNNLKNINCEIPHNQLTVITGLSGSGKSSLAFDTIFAEGQRRYLESLSSFAR